MDLRNSLKCSNIFTSFGSQPGKLYFRAIGESTNASITIHVLECPAFWYPAACSSVLSDASSTRRFVVHLVACHAWSSQPSSNRGPLELLLSAFPYQLCFVAASTFACHKQNPQPLRSISNGGTGKMLAALLQWTGVPETIPNSALLMHLMARIAVEEIFWAVYSGLSNM